jgi:hypothetical protein
MSVVIITALAVVYVAGTASGLSIAMTIVRLAAKYPPRTPPVDTAITSSAMPTNIALVDAVQSIEPPQREPIPQPEPRPRPTEGVRHVVYYRPHDAEVGEYLADGYVTDDHHEAAHEAQVAWRKLEENADQFPGVHEYWRGEQLLGYQRYPKAQVAP